MEKLLIAAEEGDIERIQKLLEDKQWPAGSSDETYESFKQYYENNPRAASKDKRSKTIEPKDIYQAYRCASHHRRLGVLKYLMRYNIHPDFAFEYAVRLKDVDFLRLLIQSGSNKDNALLWSAFFALFELVKELVETGADVNARDPRNGSTVLMYAVCAYEELAAQTTEYLISKGADIYAKNDQGNTLLHDIASPGPEDYGCDADRYRGIDYHQFRVQTWQVLKNYVTDLNPLNNQGLTPLDYANDYIELFVDMWIPLGAKRSN